MPVTNEKPAPYAPSSAILGIIERNRTHGLPSPINDVVLGRAGVSASIIPRTLQTLQALDLIHADGQPTEILDGLRLAKEAELKQHLEVWVKTAYADVFSYVDPSKDDETAIRDAFRSYQPIGQQSRMVTLFLGLCGAAGLAPEKPTQPRSRVRTSTPNPLKRTKTVKRSLTGSSDISPALAGLLAELPPDKQGWSSSEREKFMRAFGVVLDLIVPIVESESPEQKHDSEEDK